MPSAEYCKLLKESISLENCEQTMQLLENESKWCVKFIIDYQHLKVNNKTEKSRVDHITSGYKRLGAKGGNRFYMIDKVFNKKANQYSDYKLFLKRLIEMDVLERVKISVTILHEAQQLVFCNEYKKDNNFKRHDDFVLSGWNELEKNRHEEMQQEN